MVIKDFEYNSFEIAQENRSLKYQLELKDDENEIANNIARKVKPKEEISDKTKRKKVLN